MGRSVAQFALQGPTREWVLGAATAYAQEWGLNIEEASPVHVAITKGSVWWTGKRVLRVSAWDIPGGVSVAVEAWAEGLTELSADPGAFFGWLPRHDAWNIASRFVSRLGVVPEAVFRHL